MEMLHFHLLIPLSIIFLNKIVTSYQPYSDTDPEYATSVYHLRLLVQAELSLLPSLFAAYEEELLTGAHEYLGEYIHDFSTSNLMSPHINGNKSLKNFISLIKLQKLDIQGFTDETVKHPIKSYRTIRRFTLYINHFNNSSVTKNKGLLASATVMQKKLKFPKQVDLSAAMQNILRLRQIFRFKVTDLLEGQLDDLKTGSGLSVTQLVEIAHYAASLKMFTHAVDFYDEVVEHCSEHSQSYFEDCAKLNMDSVVETLKAIIIQHDTLLAGNEYDPNDINLVPPDSSPFVFDVPLKNMSSKDFKTRRFLQVDKELDALVRRPDLSRLEVNIAISPFIFEKICRGEALEANTSSLRCFYLSPHPIYKIGPLKAELHNEDPLLVQIYDVLSDKEIAQLKTEVEAEMRQSRTTSLDGDDAGVTSRFRTSANAWIEDNVDEKFQYLNERISRITGFNTTGYYASEIVQIAAYNPGGHYTPHSDAMFEEMMLNRLPESEFQRGDRIMTFMIYLSNVEKGGGTGFPTLRKLIRPVKGSAVLWYNLNSDGTINYDVFHGGCPVLYGTKWIANKWIRSNDQMFIKKCPKQKDSWKL